MIKEGVKSNVPYSASFRSLLKFMEQIFQDQYNKNMLQRFTCFISCVFYFFSFPLGSWRPDCNAWMIWPQCSGE